MKPALTITIIFFALSMIGCESIKKDSAQTIEPCSDSSSSVSIPVSGDQDYTVIVTALFDKYLGNYVLCPLWSEWKIDNYNVEEVEIYPSTIDPRIFAEIIYSVKPPNIFLTNWVAGNGWVDDSTGWIKEKYACCELLVTKTGYRFAGCGTLC